MNDNERAMRFGYLLSEIEGGARRILNGEVSDIPAEMIAIKLAYDEAWKIAVEVSRESLDKVTIRLKDPLPADTTIEDVLPDG